MIEEELIKNPNYRKVMDGMYIKVKMRKAKTPRIATHVISKPAKLRIILNGGDHYEVQDPVKMIDGNYQYPLKKVTAKKQMDEIPSGIIYGTPLIQDS